MKILLVLFVFLLPFHAIIVTYLKCKIWIDTNLIRFWKEFILVFFLLFWIIEILKKYKWNIKKIYHSNYLLWTVTAFIISSAVFMYFPAFGLKASSFLWFKYDVFPLLALIVWLFLVEVRNNIGLLLRTAFFSITLVIIIFLPWYLFWDISSTSDIFGYSKEVSTYSANSCISFAQNVNWEHRFQASFWWPIRFSVFLVLFFIIFISYIIQKYKNETKKRNTYIIVSWILVIASIFLSYTKTSMLGLIFSIILFVYLIRKIKLGKKISKKFLSTLWIIFIIPILFISIFKHDLFLHLWSVLNRFDNLSKSVEMFFYNPVWYWLGIAGPASQIWNSIESAWSWQVATASPSTIHKFLPENWYVQILLEQWLIWFALFLSVIIIIAVKLYKIVKIRKSYLSIWIFTSFITALFMANFTHLFEESATSYILFIIIWWYISKNLREK